MTLKEISDYYGSEFLTALYDEIIRLSKESPLFVYFVDKDLGLHNPCFYNRGMPNGPVCDGCLIGQALQRLGWDDKIEMDYYGPVSDLFIKYIGNCVVTQSLFSKIERAQELQDNGNPWGKCIC